jgi:hypothetical protein
MNISCASRCLAFSIILVALGSIAHAQDLVASDTNKNAQKSVPTVIIASNDTPLDQVPEPSTGSLILLGLGGACLAMKLRKRA